MLLTRQFQGGFTPLSLFSAGEEGAWYDPFDLSSMFQDSNTGSAAAVGSPVGFLGDKRLGSVFGSECLTSPTFDSSTGWTLVANGDSAPTISGGVLTVVRSAGNPYALQTFTTVVGTKYRLAVANAGATQTNVRIGTSGAFSTENGEYLTSAGVTQGYAFTATATTTYATVFSNAVGTAVFESVSIKPWNGNHAIQATSASRPVLRQDASGFYYLEFDGVDDNMATAAVAISSPLTMAASARFDNASGGIGNVFDGITLRSLMGANNGNNYRMFAGSTLAGGTRDSSNHVLLANFAGASSSLDVDGTSVSTGDAGSAGLSGGIRIGADILGTGQFLQGRFYGGLVLSRSLTASEKISLNRFLGARAGL